MLPTDALRFRPVRKRIKIRNKFAPDLLTGLIFDVFGIFGNVSLFFEEQFPILHMTAVFTRHCRFATLAAPLLVVTICNLFEMFTQHPNASHFFFGLLPSLNHLGQLDRRMIPAPSSFNKRRKYYVVAIR